MHAVVGPFIPDNNISVAMVAFDDRLWIFLRRALHDTASTVEYGVLEFADVRAYRSRARVWGEPPDTPIELPTNCWTIGLDGSEFLRASIAHDSQRTADALSWHSHFVVVDGNHRAIDIVAKAVHLRAVAGLENFDMTHVIDSEDPWSYD